MNSLSILFIQRKHFLLLLLLMIWQSPGLPGWRKVNFITVTRRPHHPNIAAVCTVWPLHQDFSYSLREVKWVLYVHRVFLSYTRDRRLKVSSERLGNEDKAPCPRALLAGRGSNRGPPVWKSEALIARPRQLLIKQNYVFMPLFITIRDTFKMSNILMRFTYYIIMYCFL